MERHSCVADQIQWNSIPDEAPIAIIRRSFHFVLNRRVAPGHHKTFEFMERGPDKTSGEEPGLKDFLQDSLLSGDATDEELVFLRALTFENRRPTALYYYRELQSLRDPLHFQPAPRKFSSR